jgi:Icc-related predicted phosphoesterase
LVKIFFTTDIHGSEKCFKKFLNAGKFYKVDVLVLGGDITGKMVIPIIEQPDTSFKCTFLGDEYSLKSKEEIERVVSSIRMTGYYPFFTNAQEMIEFQKDEKKVNELFKNLMLDTLKHWVKMAEERLRPTGIKCYITGGNDDPFEIEEILNGSDVIMDPEGKVARIDEHHEMISMGYSNITPWRCPRDVPEESLAQKIDDMASQVENMGNCIFNLHCPPYNTGIDSAMQIDEKTLKPVVIQSQPQWIPVGSAAIRDKIEKYQPLIGLHGHIHESKGEVKIGRTICFNPGSEYSEGILRGIILNLDKECLKSSTFTQG